MTMSIHAPSHATQGVHGPFPAKSTSLDLLLPQETSQSGRYYPRYTSSPGSAPTSSQQSLQHNRADPHTRQVVQHVLEGSYDIVESFNNRDYDRAKAYASPKFRAKHTNLAVELDREQHFAAYKMLLELHPSWRMDIVGQHAEVDIMRGQAYVWFFVKVPGEIEGVTRDSLGLLHWERNKEDKWEVMYHWGFRSCGMLF